MAALNGPDEAFRFAKGEPTRSSLMNTEESRLHARWTSRSDRSRRVAGRVRRSSSTRAITRRTRRPASAWRPYRHSRVIREDGRAGDFGAMVETIFSGMIDPIPSA